MESPGGLCYKEFIAPYVKRLVSAVHEMGCFYEQHSCGKIAPLIPYFISTGADTWRGQDINDKKELVEKYGNIFKFGVDVSVNYSQSDAEIIECVSRYLNTYKGKRVWYYFPRGATPYQLDMIESLVKEYGVS